MEAILFLFFIGLFAATLGSIVGLGGGIVIVPALIYLGPALLGKEIPVAVAVGTSLTVLIVTALASTLSFVKQKRIDYRSAWLFLLTSGPAAVIGASLTGYFPTSTFQLSFGIFMLFMAGLMVLRDYVKPLPIQWKIEREYTDPKGVVSIYGYNLAPALCIGFFVGLVSGLFGIGGGSLFVPLMVLLFRFPPHVATATSMLVILFSAVLGSATHWLNGSVDWMSVLMLAPGAWIGGRLGAWIASRLSGPGLMWVLRITLVVFAIRMIISGLLG